MGTVDWRMGANRWPDPVLEKDAGIAPLSQPAPAKLIVNKGRGIAIVRENSAIESPIQVAIQKKTPVPKGTGAVLHQQGAEARRYATWCALGGESPTNV